MIKKYKTLIIALSLTITAFLVSCDSENHAMHLKKAFTSPFYEDVTPNVILWLTDLQHNMNEDSQNPVLIFLDLQQGCGKYCVNVQEPTKAQERIINRYFDNHSNPEFKKIFHKELHFKTFEDAIKKFCAIYKLDMKIIGNEIHLTAKD